LDVLEALGFRTVVFPSVWNLVKAVIKMRLSLGIVSGMRAELSARRARHAVMPKADIEREREREREGERDYEIS